MAASAGPKTYKLPVHHSSCFCYGPEGQLCVASDTKLFIFDVSGNNVRKIATLEAHKHRVTGVDWNLTENRILSCGEDRNAYVWNLNDEDVWKPSLVVLRVNRAALCCKWSTSGKKFAVGTSARSIMICSYDEEHDFWVGKSIRKPKSAVTCLSWHCSDLLLAAGGTDFKCRVYNVFDPAVDEDADGASALYGNIKKFGTILGEFSSLGYVNGCAFNAEGSQLVFVSQSSQMTLVTFTGDGNTESETKQLGLLPFNSVTFAGSPEVIVAGGHTKTCHKFTVDGTSFSDPEEVVREAKAKKKKAGTSAAFAKFQNLANTGTKKKSDAAATPHAFSIADLRRSEGGFTTVANGDQNVLLWTL